MKYDDVSWHYGGDFPKELPNEAGATHIGMFVAWGTLNGLAGELHTKEFPENIERLQQREITPGQFIMDCCDGKFTDEDFNEAGNLFAEAYFKVTYIKDYESTLCHDLPTSYHVPDTWASYKKLSPVIARRFGEWKTGELAKNESGNISFDITEDKPWWKFW